MLITIGLGLQCSSIDAFGEMDREFIFKWFKINRPDTTREFRKRIADILCPEIGNLPPMYLQQTDKYLYIQCGEINPSDVLELDSISVDNAVQIANATALWSEILTYSTIPFIQYLTGAPKLILIGSKA